MANESPYRTSCEGCAELRAKLDALTNDAVLHPYQGGNDLTHRCPFCNSHLYVNDDSRKGRVRSNMSWQFEPTALMFCNEVEHEVQEKRVWRDVIVRRNVGCPKVKQPHIHRKCLCCNAKWIEKTALHERIV